MRYIADTFSEEKRDDGESMWGEAPTDFWPDGGIEVIGYHNGQKLSFTIHKDSKLDLLPQAVSYLKTILYKGGGEKI